MYRRVCLATPAYPELAERERSPRPLLVAYAWSRGLASFSIDATGQEGLGSQASIKPSRRGRLAKLEIRSSETVTSESPIEPRVVSIHLQVRPQCQLKREEVPCVVLGIVPNRPNLRLP